MTQAELKALLVRIEHIEEEMENYPVLLLEVKHLQEKQKSLQEEMFQQKVTRMAVRMAFYAVGSILAMVLTGVTIFASWPD